MIGIAAPMFDPSGDLLVEEDRSSTDLGAISRRVQRRATLDGGASFEDRGAFDADRTFQVVFRPEDEAMVEQVRRLGRSYRWLLVSTRDGLYRVAPKQVKANATEVKMTLLVESKRSA